MARRRRMPMVRLSWRFSLDLACLVLLKMAMTASHMASGFSAWTSPHGSRRPGLASRSRMAVSGRNTSNNIRQSHHYYNRNTYQHRQDEILYGRRPASLVDTDDDPQPQSQQKRRLWLQYWRRLDEWLLRLLHRSQISRFFATNKPNSIAMLPLQLCLLLALYAFHLTVLTQHVAIIGGRLVVGYDSLTGAAIALWYFAIYRSANNQQRRRQRQQHNENLATEWPWNLPSAPSSKDGFSIVASTSPASSLSSPESAATTWWKSADWKWIRFRASTLLTLVALIKAYFSTGNFSLFWEDMLFTMSAAGWPLTVPLSRSLQVLLGHLSWVAIGSLLLWALPRPPPFFANIYDKKREQQPDDAVTDNRLSGATSSTSPFRWFRMSSQNWLWWAVGGYYVSSWLFNVADALNRSLLPAQVLQEAAESVVAQLVQPEHNDVWASITGYLAPCVSAPVWEELLYRGFLLAGLTASTGSWHFSCIGQAILFSAHHMSVTGALPLAVLGWTWAVLYTHSRNLWSVILIHAMWNSRVFFGSWFGL